MQAIVKILTLTLMLLSLVNCASGKGKQVAMMPEMDQGSQANPASYGADAMTFRKDQPYRPEFKRWQFYYKSCALNGDESYYSKTSYHCAGPYY